MFTADVAALLWALLARRKSLVVLAGPSGAGKTTLLTALLDFLPPDTRRVYVRGCYESFRFLQETEPTQTVLLVNEISAHLPVYLWGPAVKQLLSAAQCGYAVAATAHARSVDEFVYSLAGYPLRIATSEIAALDVLVLLDAWEEGGTIRRHVREVALLRPGSGSVGGVVADAIAIRPSREAAIHLHLDRLDEGSDGFATDVSARATSLASQAASSGFRRP